VPHDHWRSHEEAKREAFRPSVRGGKPALVGAVPDATGAYSWKVFRYAPDRWVPETAEAFLPKFDPGTDPEAVRPVGADVPSVANARVEPKATPSQRQPGEEQSQQRKGSEGGGLHCWSLSQVDGQRLECRVGTLGCCICRSAQRTARSRAFSASLEASRLRLATRGCHHHPGGSDCRTSC
jgi:hypothetical protein